MAGCLRGRLLPEGAHDGGTSGKPARQNPRRHPRGRSAAAGRRRCWAASGGRTFHMRQLSPAARRAGEGWTGRGVFHPVCWNARVSRAMPCWDRMDPDGLRSAGRVSTISENGIPARITVTNSAGVAADMMAEFVMSAMLHFTHDFRGLEADRKARNWPARVMTPVRNKHLLILGLGKTGRALARLAKAFGMTVTGVRANPRSD